MRLKSWKGTFGARIAVSFRSITISRLLAFSAASAFTAATAHAGMATSGQLTVTSGGAASYTIPIEVPPGTAGMAPNLALNYNGQGDNGQLGIGWTLSGLSTISRCPQTMAQDGAGGTVNYDNNDRYCLDGQRLIAINGPYGADGSEYRTEIDGFTKIIANGAAGNGPSWFKVWTKSGQILEFGNTADSKIEAQGKTTVRVWALNKVQDIKGNYFTVTYTEDSPNGDYYPSRIDYTGNANTTPVLAPNQSVQFIYEARPDTAPMYQAGSLIKNTVRMTHVKTYIDTQLVKDYALTYETSTLTQRSRITSISECDSSGACLPASNIGYSNSANYSPVGGNGLPSWQKWNAGTAFTLDVNKCRLLTAADMDGDGKSDLVCAYDPGGGTLSTNTWVQLTQGNSFGAWQQWYPGAVNGFTLSRCLSLTPADVNRDGKPDLVCVYDYGSGSTGTWVQINQGATTGAWQDWSSGTAVASNAYNCKLLTAADMDGDGKPDTVCAYDNGNSTTDTWVQINQGTGFASRQQWSPSTAITINLSACKLLTVADMNGDGKSDVVCVYDYGNGTTTSWVELSQGGGTSTWQLWSSSTPFALNVANCKPLISADVNGDGKPDLVCAYDTGSGSTNTWVQLNQGNSFGTWQKWNAGTAFALNINNCKLLNAADMNGDGKSDLACVYDYGNGTTTTWVQLSQGSSFASWQVWSSGTPFALNLNNCKSLAAADVNGDGKPDLVCVYDTGSGSTNTWVQLNTTPSADVTTAITEGLGTVKSLQYKPLTDSTVYTKDSGTNAAVWPNVDVQDSRYVVSSMSVSNGTGITLTANYRYGGLKSNMNGRGSLGFRWMDVTQANSNLTTHTEYRQDWPYIGSPSLVTNNLPGSGNAGMLSQSSFTYACLNPADGSACTVAAGKRYFPYAASSNRSSWDLNGVVFPTTSSNTQYDVWGNPTQIVTSSSDGYSKKTVNTYQPADQVNWFLGRLTKTAVTNTKP